MFKKLNPFKLILIWTIGLFIFSTITIVILFTTTSGGEQSPLIFLSRIIIVGIYGILILSIVTAFMYKSWFRNNWYVNVLFFMVSLILILNFESFKEASEYGIKEKTFYVEDDVINIKREYYSFEPEKIRSESFWKNGEKDSIWTIYDYNGDIIQSEQYKNGKLVKMIVKP
jgi:hypothetical protein